MTQYGSEVGPNGPQQDMWAGDLIAGTPGDRSSDQAAFTGGAGPAGEHGLGGQAEGLDTSTGSGTIKDRIGF
jgi:hypothetical protein